MTKCKFDRHDWELVARCQTCGFQVRLRLEPAQIKSVIGDKIPVDTPENLIQSEDTNS